MPPVDGQGPVHVTATTREGVVPVEVLEVRLVVGLLVVVVAPVTPDVETRPVPAPAATDRVAGEGTTPPPRVGLGDDGLPGVRVARVLLGRPTGLPFRVGPVAVGQTETLVGQGPPGVRPPLVLEVEAVARLAAVTAPFVRPAVPDVGPRPVTRPVLVPPPGDATASPVTCLAKDVGVRRRDPDVEIPLEVAAVGREGVRRPPVDAREATLVPRPVGRPRLGAPVAGQGHRPEETRRVAGRAPVATL